MDVSTLPKAEVLSRLRARTEGLGASPSDSTVRNWLESDALFVERGPGATLGEMRDLSAQRGSHRSWAEAPGSSPSDSDGRAGSAWERASWAVSGYSTRR